MSSFLRVDKVIKKGENKIMKNEERYRVELSLNVWAESDEQAKEIAESIVEEQKKRFDNRCMIVSLQESPFGSFKERQLELF